MFLNLRPHADGTPANRLGRKRSWLLAAAVIYVGLLILSHVIRAKQPDPWPLPQGMRAVTVDAFDGRRQPSQAVRMAYRDTHPDAGGDMPVILLVHGSPAPASAVFTGFIQQLSAHGRVLAPDLPGYGYSSRDIPDYGFKAHTDYLLQFIDGLGVDPVHLVAYSMGGGAAIRLAVEEAQRVASLSLVSAIGVQELELLGDHHLNHMLHGTQLLFFWALQELTPHMGVLDRVFLNRAYARSFFDADQRPLRAMLQQVRQPTLILHGTRDHFVLPAVAREHTRLVAQSELKWVDGGHLMVFNQAREAVSIVGDFLTRVFAGNGVGRHAADDHRVRRSEDPTAAVGMAPARGYLLITYFVLIALATFISEDLACIGAGLLAARGVIGIGTAIFASFAGIVIGDLLLFAAGRYIGRAAVSRIPLKWLVNAEDLEVATGWFNARGPRIIIASRFLPGSRLPTYVTAGILGTRPLVFLFYFTLAALLWTPVLVGLSALLGHQLMDYYSVFSRYALWMVLGLVAMLYIITHVAVPTFTFRGRRLLLGKFRRWRQRALRPCGITCLPILGYVFWLGLRRGHLTLFAAANPGMPAGDVMGGSKSAILDKMAACPVLAAPHCRLPQRMPMEDKLSRITDFMDTNGLDLPLVFKPDRGRRGMGVEIIRHPERMRSYLERAIHDTIVQAYIPGREFEIFYYRYPHEDVGHILSVTEKRGVAVEGDGRNTLETLILKDRRAVCLAPLHFREHRERLFHVPDAGETIELVSVGTWGRGAEYLDADHLATEALTRTVDDISRHFDGFYCGHLDVRVPTETALRQGREITVTDVNGTSLDAGHVHVVSRGISGAWSILMRQWKVAVDIGEINHKNGNTAPTVFALLKMVFRHRRQTLM